MTKLLSPLPAPTQCSPRAAALASFSIFTSRENSSLREETSSLPSASSRLGELTTTCLSLSITPATANPIPTTSSFTSSDTIEVNCSSRSPSREGCFLFCNTFPELSIRATLMLVPPMSTPIAFAFLTIASSSPSKNQISLKPCYVFLISISHPKALKKGWALRQGFGLLF